MARAHVSLSPANAPAPVRVTRRQTLLAGAAVAAVLAGSAWGIGQWDGFNRIGTCGTHLRLLPKIGQSAPDVAVRRADTGQPVRLSAYRGHPVWLNFWGSWCPPCRSEFPDLQAAYAQALQPAGIILLAISLDESPQAAEGFARRNGGTFPILSDPDRSATGPVYPIANFPTHVLIDRGGIVRDIVLAPIDQAEITSRARRLIATTGAS